MGENKIAVPKPQREIKASISAILCCSGAYRRIQISSTARWRAQSALSFYIASHLEIFDDPYIQATFYNEFENKLSRFGRDPGGDGRHRFG